MKFRLWQDNNGDREYTPVNSVAKTILLVQKNEDIFLEEVSGLEVLENGMWDEWLDEEDQNIHEHIFMFGEASSFLEDITDDIEDNDSDEDEEIFLEEDRLLSVLAEGSRGDDSDEEDF